MRVLIPLFVILILIACNNRANNKDDVKDSARKDTTGSIITSPAGDTLFTGFGNEPFWAVYVIENTKIVFHPMDGNDVEVPFVAPATVDSLTSRYASASVNADLVLIVTKKNCSDGMSDETHQYAVDLTVNKIHYSGCGREGK